MSEAFGAYAVVSTLTVFLTLGVGFDERTASAISIAIGVSAAVLFLSFRYLLLQSFALDLDQ